MDTNSAPNEEVLDRTPTETDMEDTVTGLTWPDMTTHAGLTAEEMDDILAAQEAFDAAVAEKSQKQSSTVLDTTLPTNDITEEALANAAFASNARLFAEALDATAAAEAEAALVKLLHEMHEAEQFLSPALQSVISRIRHFGRTGDLNALKSAEAMLRGALLDLP